MIIYFSGTGNSFSIAKRLGKQTNGKVVPLKSAVNEGDENITFIFPLYCEDIPPHVRDFLWRFEIHDRQKVSAICTSGGGIGNAEFTFNRIMNKKGIKVAKFLSAPMIDNSMPILIGSKVNRVCVNEEKIVSDFIHMKYENKSTFNPAHKMTELLVYNPVSRRFLTKKVIEDQCVDCGKCERICPNDNIQIIDGKAKIGNQCAECFGCAHICPNQAIYVRKPIDKSMQYMNENIDVNEMNKSIFKAKSVVL